MLDPCDLSVLTESIRFDSEWVTTFIFFSIFLHLLHRLQFTWESVFTFKLKKYNHLDVHCSIISTKVFIFSSHSILDGELIIVLSLYTEQ